MKSGRRKTCLCPLDRRIASSVNAFMKSKYPPSKDKGRTCLFGMNFFSCPIVDTFGNREKKESAIKKNAVVQHTVIQTTYSIITEFFYARKA